MPNLLNLAKPGAPTYRRLTPKRVIKAIIGTGGRKSSIAERLGCTVTTLNAALARPGAEWPKSPPNWDNVRNVYVEEMERVNDLAEETVVSAMCQRMDTGSSLRAATWWLTQKAKNRGFADTKTLKVEGGSPIQVNHTMLPIDKLDLPVDVKKQILEAMEKYESEIQMKEIPIKQIGNP